MVQRQGDLQGMSLRQAMTFALWKRDVGVMKLLFSDKLWRDSGIWIINSVCLIFSGLFNHQTITMAKFYFL